MDIFKHLRDYVKQTDAEHPLNRAAHRPLPNYGPDADPGQQPEPIHRKVLAITHNPILRSVGNRTVREHFGWNNPVQLAQSYIEDVRYASYGYANYEIVEHLEVDAFPPKADGFRYDEHSYLRAWQQRRFHDPDGVDYLELVREFKMIERISDSEIDEVWLFGHPYGGYYESIMCGPDAFWCNAPPLQGTQHAARRFVIMGFNFERGAGEMLEDLGHRAESMFYRLYGDMPEDINLWNRFIRYDKTHPGRAECGNVHFAPNSLKDYDWGNPRMVRSNCDDWYAFPRVTGDRWHEVNCAEWGNGDIRLHHLWWFRHMPHVTGQSHSISHNWWDYIIDPNRV